MTRACVFFLSIYTGSRTTDFIHRWFLESAQAAVTDTTEKKSHRKYAVGIGSLYTGCEKFGVSESNLNNFLMNGLRKVVDTRLCVNFRRDTDFTGIARVDHGTLKWKIKIELKNK